MLEAIVQASLEVDIVQSPLPVPGSGEVLIRVICSSCNPKDWKHVESVGPDVVTLKAGDRGAAFHPMGTGGGSFAEFAIAPVATTFLLPPKVSFEEGATVPLAALTAAIGLYHSLGLKYPWAPATTSTPLVIYGASGTVGAYAVKFACRSNLHLIIAIAGAGRALVEQIIEPSKGDVIVDYREGHGPMVKKIHQALKDQGISSVAHAFDCVSEKGSIELLTDVLVQGGHATFVLPEKNYSTSAKTLRTSLTYVGYVHTGPFPVSQGQGINFIPGGRGEDFGFVFSSLISKGLGDEWFKSHPYQVINGGLGGLSTALKALKEGKASATKYVVRIGEIGSK